LLVAAVGYADDIRHLSANTRLTIHLFASAVASYWIFVVTGHAPSSMDWLSIGVFALAIAWVVNLTNFMDGIDGILGVQAVSVSLVAAGLCWIGHDGWLAELYLILAASSLGFLFLNWSPARIFMGDVGSGFIGFIYGALTLLSYWRGTLPVATGLILFGVFICDATYTLIVRAGRRCDLTVAHRDHAYQKAVQRGLSHGKVSSIVGALNFLWLAPWAYLSTRGHPIACLVLAYLPLVALALHYQAGLPHRPLARDVTAPPPGPPAPARWPGS
jgi:Fuc2NAc and GlcNAc transferase